ncbi:MAG: LuxR C-terminal-related transcriptional regulator [Treponema sp.]|jgi:LuxR family maltose regulon positive regulatory protein|nr:LuxR C-terminal-related transcriptional regulator [Treponema sp.]
MSGQIFQDESANQAALRFLERPRTDRILETALQSRVVTVVAGEGSGKTHAVNSFLRKKSRRIIWMQISNLDNLSWRFWENYIGEVARVNPDAARIFYGMGFPESGRQLDRYLGMLKDEIIGPEQHVLVLDDFHLITNPSVLRFLNQVLSMPVSRNVIIFISRMEPAINTVNFLAKGLLSRITVEDLRFTREETDAYFRLHDVVLKEDELAHLFDKTEGWPLALALILHEIKAKKNGGRSWDQVMRPVRKMEENIFSTMETPLQKFLVQLSLIDHWPRDLLERLDSGKRNIAAMEKYSSVIRFDTYLHGFRIHHLFLDFLREKQEQLSLEEIREICGKNAQWCIENGLPTDAAVNYEKARDYGGLVRLIESLPRMLPRTVASFLLDIIERLMARRAKEREDRNGENPDGKDQDSEDQEYWDFLFMYYIVRARLLAFLDRFVESARECWAVIIRFKSHAPDPNRSRILAAAYNNMGALGIRWCRYTQNYDFAGWFEKGYRYYLENPEPVRGQIGQSIIGSYAIHVGASATPKEVDAFIDACAAAAGYTAVSLSGYLCGTGALARSELAYYQGDLNRAEQFARQAAYQGHENNQYEVETSALFYLMRLNIHRGDINGIRQAEQQMKVHLERGGYSNRHNVHDIIMGRFYIRLGLIDRIAPWLRMEGEEGELNVLSRGFDTLVRARALIIEKKYSAALSILEKERNEGDLESFLVGCLEMALLEAIVRYRLGDTENAAAAFKRAYEVHLPHGLVMPFVELGENMYSLIGAFLKDRSGNPPLAAADGESPGIPRKWLETIRRNASAYAKKRALVKAWYTGQETPVHADFSQHELAILNSLSQGQTSEEIAGAMRISVKMVKSAVRSLYIKLGASNRAGAIRAATERGLLSDTR